MALRREHHAAVSDLCARLFAEPMGLVERIAHGVEGPFRIASHKHEDVLQLDVLEHVDGRAWLGDREGWATVRGLSLLVHYPGDRHGFDLNGRRGSRVCHLKLRVGPDWLIAQTRPWPRAHVDLPRMDRLTRQAWEVAEHPMANEERPPLLLAAMATVLGLWPGVGVSTAEAEAVEDARDLANAVRLIQQRLGDPPDVREMAAAAHLSPRHFSRRFQNRFGCTPMQFVHAHRLDRAKTLLLGARHGVSDVAEQLGFSSHAAFTRWFVRHAGETPSRFRANPASA